MRNESDRASTDETDPHPCTNGPVASAWEVLAAGFFCGQWLVGFSGSLELGGFGCGWVRISFCGQPELARGGRTELDPCGARAVAALSFFSGSGPTSSWAAGRGSALCTAGFGFECSLACRRRPPQEGTVLGRRGLRPMACGGARIGSSRWCSIGWTCRGLRRGRRGWFVRGCGGSGCGCGLVPLVWSRCRAGRAHGRVARDVGVAVVSEPGWRVRACGSATIRDHP